VGILSATQGIDWSELSNTIHLCAMLRDTEFFA
jgi:hypothetical protein